MNVTGIPALAVAVTNPSSTPTKAGKLHDAAQQFESLMIGEMMRTERESGSDGWLGSGDDTGDDSAMDMAEAQLSNALAAGGGLGLAKMVEKTMQSSAAGSQPTTAARFSGSVVSGK